MDIKRVTYLILMFLSLNSLALEFDATNYYLKDSDLDGVVDKYDKRPYKYDVSDRDLRFFQRLAYRSEEELRKIFSNDKEAILKFNEQRLNSSADVTEIVKVYDFVMQKNFKNGFSASIFKNGKTAILAFRGTNDLSDAKSDGQIAISKKAEQAENAIEMYKYLKDYDSFYLTGHSLGGYLAQYFGATVAYNDPRFKHAAIFNSPQLYIKNEEIINERNISNLEKIYVDDSDKKNVKVLKKIQAYSIFGDSVSYMKPVLNTLWNKQVNFAFKHSSSNFIPEKYDENFKNWFSKGYRLDLPYLNIDTDKDGILDVDEYKIGTNPNFFDTDFDGFSDKIELLLNTKYDNEKSKPKLSEFYKLSRKDGVLGLEIKEKYIDLKEHIPSISKLKYKLKKKNDTYYLQFDDGSKIFLTKDFI